MKNKTLFSLVLYLFFSLMLVVPTLGADYYSVEAKVLNVRRYPSASADKIGTFAKGDTIRCVKMFNDKWMEVAYEGWTGYIHVAYTKYLYSKEDEPDKFEVKHIPLDLIEFLDSTAEILNLPQYSCMYILILTTILLFILHWSSEQSYKISVIKLCLTLIEALLILYNLFALGYTELADFIGGFNSGIFGELVIPFIFFGILSFILLRMLQSPFEYVCIYNGWVVNWQIGRVGLYVSAILLIIDYLFNIGFTPLVLGLICVYQIGFCIYACIKIKDIRAIWVVPIWLITSFATIFVWPIFLRLTFIITIITAMILFCLWLVSRKSSNSSGGSKRYRTSSGEELTETGINTYLDSYGNKWSGDGSGNVWKE